MEHFSKARVKVLHRQPQTTILPPPKFPHQLHRLNIGVPDRVACIRIEFSLCHERAARVKPHLIPTFLHFDHYFTPRFQPERPAHRRCCWPLKPGSLGRCLHGARPVLSDRCVRLTGGDTDVHGAPLQHPRAALPLSNHLWALEKALPDVE